MTDFGFPILSALIWIPVIAGVIILFIPANMRDLFRGVAITAAFVTLASDRHVAVAVGLDLLDLVAVCD